MFRPIDLAVYQPVTDINVIDHNALVSTFQVENNNTCGPGYWKMNNQHFNVKKFSMDFGISYSKKCSNT